VVPSRNWLLCDGKKKPRRFRAQRGFSGSWVRRNLYDGFASVVGSVTR
jgi:hypothetical protein